MLDFSGSTTVYLACGATDLLTYVLEKMKNLGPFPEKEDMIKLLPWSPAIPDDCRSKMKK